MFLCRWRIWLPVLLALIPAELLACYVGQHTRRPSTRILTAEKCAALYDCEVRPLLASRCVRCHGPKRRAGGLRVDTIAAMLDGGDSGPVCVRLCECGLEIRPRGGDRFLSWFCPVS